jgi:tRNA U34 5-carboxymethylaminomethyl modifying GTPase MnmE/TrmE
MKGMPKKSEWRTPLRARPEPITRAEIEAEIDFLEDRLNGQLDEAIEHRIKELRERLDSVKPEKG